MLIYQGTDRVVPYSFKYKNNLVNLIDVPGLNDRSHPASQTFKTIATWLYDMQTNHEGAWLNGVIYLHDITKARIEQSDLECITLLQKICGDAAANTWIILNKCDRVPWSYIHPHEQSSELDMKQTSFETEFPEYQGHVIRKNRQSQTHTRACLDTMMNARPFEVQLIAEVKHNKVLAETSAGKYLISTKLEPGIKKLELDIRNADDSVKRENLEAQLKALMKERDDMFRINKEALTAIAVSVNSGAGALWTIGATLVIIPHVGVPILLVAAVVQAIGLGFTVAAATRKDDPVKKDSQFK